MADDNPIDQQGQPRVRLIPDVPVYDCHVYLSPLDEQGLVHVRAAALTEVVTTGKNERDALRNVVAKFKEVVGRHVSRGEPIPWLVPPNAIKLGEIQRFIPVHF
jgi:hypothetical protein